jgi:hypothetical protein
LKKQNKRQFFIHNFVLVKNKTQIILKKIILILTILISSNSFSQIGGDYSFSFLNLAENSKVASLGGELISAFDSTDINTGVYNPANIQLKHNKMIGVNFMPLKQGIKKSSISYVHEIEKIGAINLSIQHIGYGEIQSTNNLGVDIGIITPQEYVISLGKSIEQGIFRMGMNLKFAGSSFGQYSAYGILMDFGGTMVHPKKDLTASLLVRNLGFAIKKYTKDSELTMPLNVLAGITYKPEHMPIRFNITTHDWQKWEIQYLDSNQTFNIDTNGDKIREEKKFSENLFRHLNVGTEIILSQNLQFRVGYNHMRRKELKGEIKGGSGFSFGGMIKIKRITLEYSKAYYFAGSGSSVISIITHFKKK